jgi:hypothetical protein
MEPAESERSDPGGGHLRVWLVRLVLYPLAIVLIAAVWHQRSADRSGDAPAPVVAPPTARWTGATSGGGAIAARTVAGRLVYFDAFLTYRCAGRAPIRIRWLPGPSDVFALKQGGEAVGGQVGPGRVGLGPNHTFWMVTIRIRGRMGRYPRGTLWGTMVTVPWTHPRPRTWTRASCRTGPVRYVLDQHRP